MTITYPESLGHKTYLLAQDRLNRQPLCLAIALAFSTSAQAATYTVSNTNNSGSGSLRQAVLNANASAGLDEINFNTASGSTITLSGSELKITDSLKITGPGPGNPNSITINGAGKSRIINASIPANGELTLENMTLTNGHMNGRGGALIMAGSVTGKLNLNHTVVSGSSTSGSLHEGGGLYVSNAKITLNDSTISGNSTSGSNSPGGGLFANEVLITLNNSTISGNSTSGLKSPGGGLYSDGDTTLNHSTISGNTTSGSESHGAGIYIYLNAILNQSTISGNSTRGSGAHGGGVFVYKGNTTLNQSTITNNSSTGAGGGLFTVLRGFTVSLKNSILSGNTGSFGNFIDGAFTGAVNAQNSLFGDSVGEITGTNIANVFTNSPNLGTLKNNGGPTLTHLPNSTSPAKDAGSNAFASTFGTDQRGAGFLRIQNGTVDIGSTEIQVGAPPAAATQNTPSGNITDSTPRYSWNAVANSSWYYLWVNDATGNKIATWYTAADVGCGNGTGTCNVTPSRVLASGDGKWWVQTWNHHGIGPWSTGKSFYVDSSSTFPPAATLVSPNSTITDNTPTYTWNAVANSSWYYLWVNDTQGNKVKIWYTSSQAGCAKGTGTCSVAPGTALSSGSAQWWIQTWNHHGYGPWSRAKSFTVTP